MSQQPVTRVVIATGHHPGSTRLTLSEPTRQRGPAPRRLATVGSAVTAIAVLLLLTAPLGEAKPDIVDQPPYHSLLSSASNSTLVPNTRCSTETLLVPPRAHASTGVVRVASFVGANTGTGYHCKPTITTLSSFLGAPFKASSSGAHRVVYTWQITWNASGCDGQRGPGRASILLFGNVYDSTTAAWVLNGSVAKTLYRSPSGPLVGCWSKSGTSQNVSISFTGNLTAGHNFLLYTGLNTSTSASAGAHCLKVPTCLGSYSEIDIGTLGYGAQLISMKVV